MHFDVAPRIIYPYNFFHMYIYGNLMVQKIQQTKITKNHPNLGVIKFIKIQISCFYHMLHICAQESRSNCPNSSCCPGEGVDLALFKKLLSSSLLALLLLLL